MSHVNDPLRDSGRKWRALIDAVDSEGEKPVSRSDPVAVKRPFSQNNERSYL
jgi:hypothetical protein